MRDYMTQFLLCGCLRGRGSFNFIAFSRSPGDEKKGLEMLLKVRSAIETFYGKLDALTTSMEDTVAAKPTSVASELIREDVHLKPALDGYNEMVGTFYELHGTDMDIYGHSMAEDPLKDRDTICAKKAVST